MSAARSPFSAQATLTHALDLGDELIDGLRARGLEVITPLARAERAGNVCFLAQDGAALAARLAERDVLVWGSEGRIRVSAHLYNDSTDLTQFFTALDAARG